MIRFAIAMVLAAGATGCARGIVGSMQRPIVPSELDSWSLSGRLGLANGRDSGSGKFEWHQRGEVTELSFHAALGQGSWRLTASPREAMMHTGRGETLVAANVADLLTQHLSWDIPVEALRYWVLGLPHPHQPQVAQRDPAGRLSVLEQSGWRVVYRSYYETDGRSLPHKLSASHGQEQVRLVVRKWGIDTPP